MRWEACVRWKCRKKLGKTSKASMRILSTKALGWDAMLLRSKSYCNATKYTYICKFPTAKKCERRSFTDKQLTWAAEVDEIVHNCSEKFVIVWTLFIGICQHFSIYAYQQQWNRGKRKINKWKGKFSKNIKCKCHYCQVKSVFFFFPLLPQLSEL